MMPELQTVLTVARQMEADELLELLSSLEIVRGTAFMRLATISTAPRQADDKLLNVEEAAERLGVSENYLYRHSGQYPFTRREGRKLLFSSVGIDRHIQQRRK